MRFWREADGTEWETAHLRLLSLRIAVRWGVALTELLAAARQDGCDDRVIPEACGRMLALHISVPGSHRAQR